MSSKTTAKASSFKKTTAPSKIRSKAKQNAGEKAPNTEAKAAPAAHTGAASTPKTLGELAETYTSQLKALGKTESTIWGYGMELKIAMNRLGEATALASLDAATLTAFFHSDLVTKTRTGKAKAKPTIDKTRRVLRLALDHAVALGWIERTPLEEQWTTRGGKEPA